MLVAVNVIFLYAVGCFVGASVFIITLHASLTGISVEEHEVELDEITAVS